MKSFTLIFVLLGIGYSGAFPTWAFNSASARGPGWSDGAVAASLYPALTNPYGGYGYAPASPVYIGSYSSSPSFPGYTPGLYGLGYLNLRG